MIILLPFLKNVHKFVFSLGSFLFSAHFSSFAIKFFFYFTLSQRNQLIFSALLVRIIFAFQNCFYSEKNIFTAAKKRKKKLDK
jgi:hypothetical protein